MDNTVKTHITVLIMRQVENAKNAKNSVAEHNYRNLLNTANLFSEEQAKAFLLGMEFKQSLPNEYQFGSF